MPSPQPNHVNSLEAWREYVNSKDPEPVEPLDVTAASSMSEEKRGRHRNRRLAYHLNLGTITTPTYVRVQATVKTALERNPLTSGAKQGVALSGPPNTGKTEALKRLGRAVERSILSPDANGSKVPVLYVTLPPNVTGKGFYLAIANFLALTQALSRRPSEVEIRSAVHTVLANGQTQLVIFDEAQRLASAARGPTDASDYLKYLSDSTGVTIVVGGSNIDAELFTQGRGTQLASRYKVLPTEPYGLNTKAEHRAWIELLADIEGRLRLANHERGTLKAHAEQLHVLTGGYLGALMTLVRDTAHDAINSGKERLDAKSFDNATLDFATTTRHAASVKRKRR